MIAKPAHKNNSAILIKKTLTVILAGVFLFTNTFGWAEEERLFSTAIENKPFSSRPADNNKLAPSSILSSREFKTSFAANAICELIENKARYAKPLTEVTLDDIAKWKNSTDPELDNCIVDS